MKCKIQSGKTTICLDVSTDEEALLLKGLWDSSDFGKNIGVISSSTTEGLQGIRGIRLGDRRKHGF